MKISGIIYFFAPLEKDFKERKELREHLARPTCGRLFLQKNDSQQWTIPFDNICHLISILNEVRSKEVGELDFTVEDGVYNKTVDIKDRRCFRISVTDINAEYHPRKYSQFLDKVPEDDFSDKSTGMFIFLDRDEEHKQYKQFFTDWFDAGIKLNKAFTKEVRQRIKVEEEVNIPYNVED